MSGEKQIKVVAIIPARGGSKGVPGKNIRLLAGYPLIAYSVVAAKLAKQVEHVMVSTDSQEIADVSRYYGADVPFMRPAQYAGDHSTDREFLLHAMEWYRENKGYIPEYWVHLRPTTPLRLPGLIDQAIEHIARRSDATSLRSGHPAPEVPYKWFEIDERGYFRGIRPADSRPEYYNLPRQAFPTVYIPNGYVDIILASVLMGSSSIHGSCMVGFETPVVTEIDTLEAFDFLMFQMQREESLLLKNIKIRFPQKG